jgi:hypothetical protein
MSSSPLNPNLYFSNIDSSHLKKCFLAAYARFPSLHQNQLTLEQLQLRGYTMRAQPIIDKAILFRASRKYRIQFSDHLEIARYVKPAELPKDVLTGWFAHELGHLIDYQRRTPIGMIGFIIGYVISAKYRSKAERTADLFALERGFGQELMATKRYILEKSKLPERYKARIRKFYMSPDELELLISGKEGERVNF